MTYSVLVTSRAESDLGDIAEYIAIDLENPTAADSLVNAIEDEFASLAQFPNRGAVVRDAVLASFGIRFALVRNYSVFYQVDEAHTQVFVLRILHMRRNWRDLLRP